MNRQHVTATFVCNNKLFRFVDAILKNTIELYAIDSSTSSETHLSPLHIVALIDTKAGWFSKWMVRQILIVYFQILVEFSNEEIKFL